MSGGEPQDRFKRIALLGIGLIGSSLARAVREHGLAGDLVAYSPSQASRDKATQLGLVDRVFDDPGDAVADADLVVLCAPVGASGPLAAAITPHLAEGAIVTDVGSVKQAVIDAVGPHLPGHVAFVPAHPIAGTEHSGPESGFATLFAGRWCVLTPEPDCPRWAVDRVAALWRAVGSHVDEMPARHHDLVLAITSHIPHLVAYSIVGTVDDLEGQTKSEVIKYAAGGFRDFTRIAASDPVMWRDIFLNNREAVLEMLGRFTEDLVSLQRAIRWSDGERLETLFTRTRAIRRGVLQADQA